MDCILLKTGCQSKLESFEKYLSLSDYTDLKNDYIDFWTFPEISKVEAKSLRKHLSNFISLSFLRKQESRRKSERNNLLDTRFRGYDRPVENDWLGGKNLYVV